MRTIVVVIALFTLVAVGAVAAQAPNHGVAVTIPEVLRLRVDPDSSRLEVNTSSRWQLSASYSPAGDGAGSAPLARSLGDGWNTFRSWDAVVADGAPTCGWRAVDVGYGVSMRAAEGIERGIIVYTLARP